MKPWGRCWGWAKSQVIRSSWLCSVHCSHIHKLISNTDIWLLNQSTSCILFKKEKTNAFFCWNLPSCPLCSVHCSHIHNWYQTLIYGYLTSIQVVFLLRRRRQMRFSVEIFPHLCRWCQPVWSWSHRRRAPSRCPESSSPRLWNAEGSKTQKLSTQG